MQGRRSMGGNSAHRTSDSSFSKKRSSAGFCARGRTTVRLVVLGEKATVPWDSISFWASLMRSLRPLLQLAAA